MKTCTRCGGWFDASTLTGGRPRSRCDACRTNHSRMDGTAWRNLRAQVLAEEPVCCVAGCGRRSTQVDHVIPLQRAPELALERFNLRGICARHNASKGAKVGPGAYRTTDPAEPTGSRPHTPDCGICRRCQCTPRQHHYCL